MLCEDRYTVRLYLRDSADPQVYDGVKHVWWQAHATVLAVLQVFDDGTYRYLYWPREAMTFYQVTPARFEAIWHGGGR